DTSDRPIAGPRRQPRGLRLEPAPDTEGPPGPVSLPWRQLGSHRVDGRPAIRRSAVRRRPRPGVLPVRRLEQPDLLRCRIVSLRVDRRNTRLHGRDPTQPAARRPVTRSTGNIDSAHSQLGRSGARLSLPEASAVAERLYHVRALAFDLPSERDQNVLLESESGERFFLNLANPAERRAVLEAECAVMLHLEPTGLTPRLIRTVEGSAIGMHGPQLVRLISALPGTTLATARLHTKALRRDLGRAVGRLGRALTNFDHPAFHRDFHWDLANAERVIATYLPLVA